MSQMAPQPILVARPSLWSRFVEWIRHEHQFELVSSHVIDDCSGDAYATVIRRCPCGAREVSSTRLLH